MLDRNASVAEAVARLHEAKAALDAAKEEHMAATNAAKRAVLHRESAERQRVVLREAYEQAKQDLVCVAEGRPCVGRIPPWPTDEQTTRVAEER